MWVYVCVCVCVEVVAITMLKPCQQSVWSSWLMPKQNQDILPPNLKSRSWDNFPSTEARHATLCPSHTIPHTYIYIYRHI